MLNGPYTRAKCAFTRPAVSSKEKFFSWDNFTKFWWSATRKFPQKLLFSYVVYHLRMTGISPSAERQIFPCPQCLLLWAVRKAALILSVPGWTIWTGVRKQDNFPEEFPAWTVFCKRSTSHHSLYVHWGISGSPKLHARYFQLPRRIIISPVLVRG